MARYKPMRIPEIAYNNFLIKKKNMEIAVEDILGRKINIPLTRVIMTASALPTNVTDDYLIDIARNKKKVVKCIKINVDR